MASAAAARSGPPAEPQRLRALARHWFSETELVAWQGRRYLHKRYRVPWLGAWLPALPRALARHELAFARELAGLRGVAPPARPYGECALLREWVEGSSLRECARAGVALPAAFFDELRALVDALHARGIAHNDLERKGNVLVDAAGHPVLIDFQIALRGYRGRSRLLRALSQRVLRELQRQDLRYLHKSKRKLRPDLCSAEDLRLARERSPLARAYRPLWRVLHGLKRALVPKGSDRLRFSRRT